MKGTMQVRRLSRALLAVLAAAALAGCRGEQQSATRPPGGQPDDQVLQILCGGSFQPPLQKLAEMFEAETGHQVELVVGQSEDHLPKVKTKAAGDVFVSHDPYLDYTEQAGAMLRWVQVGYVSPVLVVEKGTDLHIQSIEDLARPGLRVVLPNPEYSTCGEMVFELLEKKGIKDQVLANVGNAQVRSHAEVATAIKLGHRDAGIMWNGVAHNWLDAIEIVPTPYEYDEEIRVGVMGLSYSEKRELIEEFLKFVEQHGEEVFRQFGFVKTPGLEESPARQAPSVEQPAAQPQAQTQPQPKATPRPASESEIRPQPQPETDTPPQTQGQSELVPLPAG